MGDKRIRKLPLMITALLMIFIFIQSALPADLSQQESGVIVLMLSRFLSADQEVLSFAVRKCAHFTEYMLLGMSLYVTVGEFFSFEEGSAVVHPVSWGIGTLYAVTDEVHQHFVPGRSCEIRDILIDSCGVAAGVLLMTIIRSVRGRRN